MDIFIENLGVTCSSSLGDRFSAPLSFRAGNVKIIRSWLDVGCGNYLSKELYPELYLIATDRDSMNSLFTFLL